MLNENGLLVQEDLKPTDINVEIHYANVKEGGKIGSGLVVHYDNDGGIEGLLHTFIVYLDIECEGGELEIYDDKGKKILETIDVRSVKPEEEKKIVMFNGGLYHKPKEVTQGHRVIVSYQIRQRNTGSTTRRSGGTNPNSSSSKQNSSVECPRFDTGNLTGKGINWAA